MFYVTPEILADQQPSGFPPFRLELKIGAPVVILRNLNLKAGLANGTRGVVIACRPNKIRIRIIWFVIFLENIFFISLNRFGVKLKKNKISVVRTRARKMTSHEFQ